jgi:flagellar biosynthesis protein FlhB
VTDRPFPPSPRRLALARQAGLVAASPIVVGALACAAIATVLALGLGSAAHALGDAIAAACAHTDTATASVSSSTTLVASVASIPLAVLALATPLLGAAALAALLCHLAQTRTLWLPRRHVTGAPALDRNAATRTRGAAGNLAAAIVIGAVAFGWLWLAAPRLASLVELTPAAMLAATAALGVTLLAALATTWLALGILDALARHLELSRALAMTAADKRDDDRLSAADPRWARHRAALARTPSFDTAVRASALILLGDDLAIAIGWDPLRRPIPARLAIGRRARATQLVGLARRHGIAVHRDTALATALGDSEGPVPDRHWARLAQIIAAVRR